MQARLNELVEEGKLEKEDVQSRSILEALKGEQPAGGPCLPCSLFLQHAGDAGSDAGAHGASGLQLTYEGPLLPVLQPGCRTVQACLLHWPVRHSLETASCPLSQLQAVALR